MTETDDRDDQRPLSLREVAGSLLAAAVGIRSGAGRERDFRRGSPRQYVVLGVLFTLLFALLMWCVVRLVLALATP